MKPPSERARLVLERYKEGATMGAVDRARLGDVIRERVMRGDLPRFDIQPGTPIVPQLTLAQKLVGSVFAKIGLAVVVLGAAGGVGYQMQQKQPPKLADASAARPTPEPPAVVVSAAAPEVNQAATDGALPTLPTVGSSPPTKPEKTRLEAPSASAVEPTIDEEVKLVTAAQAALRSGDTRRALTLLNEHATRFPSGKLATLRQVTHMMALCQSGRAQPARDEARDFLAKNPKSPFAERVSGICSAGK